MDSWLEGCFGLGGVVRRNVPLPKRLKPSWLAMVTDPYRDAESHCVV